MVQFDIITSLPSSLACNVLRDWLSLKSVMALDTAYCSKANRGHFESVLQSDEYFIREKFSLDEDCFPKSKGLNGLLKFGKSLRSIEINDQFSLDQQLQSLAHHCQNLTYVFYRGSGRQPKLWNIIRANVKLDWLELHFQDYWEISRVDGLPPPGLPPPGLLLPNLKTLLISGSDDGQILEVLKICTGIVRLRMDLSRSYDHCTLLQIPQLCPALQSLGFAGTHLTVGVLSQLTASCPRLKHLDLYNTGLTDAGVLAVVQNLKGLQSLNIMQNRNLKDASLVHIYTHCANTLETLHLHCRGDDGELYGATTVHTLLERCTKLRTLYFAYYNSDEDTDITMPASCLSNLTTLILEGNVASDRNLAAIGKYGVNLKVLAIFEPLHYTYNSLMGLTQGCSNLKELHFDFCGMSRYDEALCVLTMAQWKESRPKLIIDELLPVHLTDFDVLNM